MKCDMKKNRIACLILFNVLCVFVVSCRSTTDRVPRNGISIQPQPSHISPVVPSTNPSVSAGNDPSMSYEQQISLGYKLLDEGEFEEAILAFDNAIAMDAERDEAFIGKADVFFTKGGDNYIIDIHDSLSTGYEIKQSENIIYTYTRYVNELQDLGRSDLAGELLQYGYESTGNEKLKERLDLLPVNTYTIWEEFLSDGIRNAEYKGASEWETVSFSNFDASAEYDIDNDGETELILRYHYPTYDFGDIEIIDFAYIILKKGNGSIVEIADLWNSGGLENNVMKYDGKNLIVLKSMYADIALIKRVLILSNGEFIELFSFTEYAYSENSYLFFITEENGVKYLSFYGIDYKEKYLGNGVTTNNPSVNTYEELLAVMDEIESYSEIEFS